VRKLGERILPEIIPILENGLNNPDGDKRQGVCIGLSEIMNSTSRDMIAQFEDSLINTVRAALVDPLAQVRLAASETFENLHNAIGHRALDGVLPDVFKKLVRKLFIDSRCTPVGKIAEKAVCRSVFLLRHYNEKQCCSDGGDKNNFKGMGELTY